MAPWSDWASTKAMEGFFKGLALPIFATLEVALYTDSLTAAGVGTEATGGGYVRQEVAVSDFNVTGSPAVATNSNLVNFGTATAAWGTIISVGLWDKTTGELVAFDDLGSSVVVDASDPVVINIGQLTVTGKTS